MTSESHAPEIEVPRGLVEEILAFCQQEHALEQAEGASRRGEFPLAFKGQAEWASFRHSVLRAWQERDHVVLRGLPIAGDGASLLWAGPILGAVFRTYHHGKIVKLFRMSPWTRELSHTLEEGHFHTDLNTAPTPPNVTVIQCVEADPGAPEHGQNRVARVSELLARLEEMNAKEAVSFLTNNETTMVNDASADSWTGKIVSEGSIRFHPETIRAAERRAGRDGTRFDDALAMIRQAALDVSRPILLQPGDVLAVSNRRALHYRNACTIRFERFPTEFASRRINVAHLMGEPA